MYSQYQYYQQQNGGISVTAQQPSVQWNGSSWVSAASVDRTATMALQTSSQLLYQPQQNLKPLQQQPYQQQQSTIPTGPSSRTLPSHITNPVFTFTQYYHGWHALQEEYQNQLASFPTGTPHHSEIQNKFEWAKYYAENSSRAAHFFNSNPGATATTFDLPPAPPAKEPGTTQPQNAASLVASQPHGMGLAQQQQQQNAINSKQQTGTPSGGSANASMSLKRYVDRCMQQCVSDSQKKEMTSMVEARIKAVFKSGKFHSYDWDGEPVLQIPSVPVIQQPILQQQYQGRDGSPMASVVDASAGINHGQSSGVKNDTPAAKLSFRIQQSVHHGHGSSKKHSHPSIEKKRKSDYQKHLPANDSYYGPSASSPALASSSSSSVSTHRSFENQQTSPSRSIDPDLDFISISREVPAKKQRHSKTPGKDALNQSSSVMGRRAQRFSGPGGIADASTATTTGLLGAANWDRYMGKSVIQQSKKSLDDADYENMTVKGTCTTLEKDYLRLTAPPRAELVRPQPILEQHLENIKSDRKRSPDQRRDYSWFCSQLKAVRQDCTVQRIQNAFAVDVYETHARIALEEGDLNEYNQCQTQLKYLYDMLSESGDAVRNRNEFVAYRLLYYVFLTGNAKYDGGSSDLFKIMLSLTAEQRSDPCIKHALAVRVAVADMDYHAFFLLRRNCPNLGGYLMDRIAPGMRHRALQRICKALRPSVDVRFVLQELGFLVDGENDDMEFGKEWLRSCGCLIDDKGDEINTKDSEIRESEMEDRKSLI